MHQEAHQWLIEHGTGESVSVLDIGGRNINGTARDAFPNASSYTVLDILDSPGVDIVADAASWEPDKQYDVVVSSECFEHAEDWREIVVTAFDAVRPGGIFLATMAGPGRPLHSGHDGGPSLYDGEHYANVDPEELREALEQVGFQVLEIDQQVEPRPCDVRAMARKQGE